MKKLYQVLNNNPKFLQDFSQPIYKRFKVAIQGHDVSMLQSQKSTMNESMIWWTKIIKKYPMSIGLMEIDPIFRKELEISFSNAKFYLDTL